MLIVKASQMVMDFGCEVDVFPLMFPEQSMTKIKTFDKNYHNYPDNNLSPLVISSSLTNIRVRGPQVSLTMGPGGQNILRLHKKIFATAANYSEPHVVKNTGGRKLGLVNCNMFQGGSCLVHCSMMIKVC